MLPWSIKIVYGLISDNVPLFGSKRRSYCILLSFLNFASAVLLYFFCSADVYFTTALLTAMSLSVAAMDVIVDSIMVIQSRRFPDDGSE